jgi:hypothetical protein
VNISGRLEIIPGDSTITVPKFVEAHPDVQCDLVLTDGGHFGDIPYKDMKNLRKISHEGTLLLIDDYGTCPYCNDVKKCFDRIIDEKLGIKIACSNTCYNQHRGGHVVDKNINALNASYHDCEEGHHLCYARFTGRG